MLQRFFIPIIVGVCTFLVAGAVIFFYSYSIDRSQVVTDVGAALPQLSGTDLIRGSSVIVIGQIGASKSKEVPSAQRLGKTDIITDTTVAVDHYLYNPRHATTTQITVETLGGTVGDTSMNVENSPMFRQGQQMLLFLSRKSSGVYTVFGWADGAYTINADGTIGSGSENDYMNNVFGGKETLSSIRGLIASVIQTSSEATSTAR